MSNLLEHHKSFNAKIAEKSKKLLEITEKLENVKKEIEERGSSMTDGSKDAVIVQENMSRYPPVENAKFYFQRRS